MNVMAGWMQSVKKRNKKEIPKWRNSIKFQLAKKCFTKIPSFAVQPSRSYFKCLTTVACDILYYFQNIVKILFYMNKYDYLIKELS